MRLRLPLFRGRTLAFALAVASTAGTAVALLGSTAGCVGKNCNGPGKPATASAQACMDCLNAGGGCPGGNNWSFEINKTCKCTSATQGPPTFNSIVGPE